MATHADRPLTVAVTGATGFVGRAVVRALLDRGHRVRALVRDLSKARETLPNDPRVTLVLGSVLDGRSPAELLAHGPDKADALIHLIGIIRRDGAQTFQRMHVDAVQAMIDACRNAGIRRFVHMSALGVHPDGKAEYQRTKFAGEQLVRRSGLDWTVIRPGLIHGPEGELVGFIRQWVKGAKQPFFFVPYFSRIVEHDEGVLLGRISFEPAACAPVSVLDVARVFADAVSRPQTFGEVYNLVGSEDLDFARFMRFYRDNIPGAERSMPVIGIPGPVAAIQAQVASAIGLGGLLPFDHGQALMATEDSTASLDKVRAHFGFTPEPFTQAAARYVGSLT